MPGQGWKLHISVSTKDSVPALKKALPILIEEVAPFKFLLDPSIVSLVNGKLWPRSSSGKFVTIYPASLEQFSRLGDCLSAALKAFVGPYILSDRRWPGSSCGEQARRESGDFATGAAGSASSLDRLLKAEESSPRNFNFVLDELLPDARTDSILT